MLVVGWIIRGIVNVDQATSQPLVLRRLQKSRIAKCCTSVFWEFAQMCLFLSYNRFIWLPLPLDTNIVWSWRASCLYADEPWLPQQQRSPLITQSLCGISRQQRIHLTYPAMVNWDPISGRWDYYSPLIPALSSVIALQQWCEWAKVSMRTAFRTASDIYIYTNTPSIDEFHQILIISRWLFTKNDDQVHSHFTCNVLRYASAWSVLSKNDFSTGLKIRQNLW